MQITYVDEDCELLVKGVKKGTFIIRATQVDYPLLESICLAILQGRVDDDVREDAQDILRIMSEEYRGKPN